jgi:hypothetical protein
MGLNIRNTSSVLAAESALILISRLAKLVGDDLAVNSTVLLPISVPVTSADVASVRNLIAEAC